MVTIIIGLDAGHCKSGADTGAIGCGYKEEFLTREVVNALSRILQKQGHKVVICNVDKANSVRDSLNYRANKANNNNVNIFVSVHFNSSNTGGFGTEIYTYNAKEIPEAKRILNNLAKLGFKNRGVKDGSNLAVIRNTNAKAMLVEVCFIDNAKDMELYNKLGAYKIATAIAEGIVNKTIEVPKAPTNKLDKKAVKEQLYNITCSLNNYAASIKDNSILLNNIKALQGVIIYLDSHSNINKQDVIKQVYGVTCSLNSYASKVKNNKCVLDNTRALNGVIDYLNTHN